MRKTPEHQALLDEVAAARAVLADKLQALRVYRRARLAKLQAQRPKIGRPSGLEDAVFAVLSPVRRMTPALIAREVGCTRQGARRALMRLVDKNRARRVGKANQHTFYFAIPQRQAAE